MMTHKTNLPQPLDDATPSPRALLTEAERLVAVYLRTLTRPQTIKTYNTELTLFISFLEDTMGKGLGDLTAEDISLYREHLIGVYAAATAAKKLAVLRRFLIFTYMAGATTVNPESLRFFAKSPRVRQDPAYNVLTEDELSRMLNAARASNYRDYVLLAVMAGCGLREVEVVGLRIGDFRQAAADQVLLRILGKGEKVRNVSISPDLWRLIQRYVLLTERSFTSYPDSRKPLFTSRVGKDKPLTTRSVQNIVKKYVRAAGITKAISPHSIRHTVGTNMALNEAPLLVIQQFLGHSDPKTTLRYIRRAEELATRAYQYNTLPL
jgi:site-specific recombinase XerD